MIGKEDRIKIYQASGCGCNVYIVYKLFEIHAASLQGKATVERVEEFYCSNHCMEERIKE